jgi:hypothetical protein
LAEDGSGEGVGPSGAFSFSSDRDVGSCAFEDTEGEFAQDGEVFRAVVFAVSGAILVEDQPHPSQEVEGQAYA